MEIRQLPPKPSKFTLICSEDTQNGFTLKFESHDEKTLDTFKSLTEKLFDKIEKISIKIGEQPEY